MLFFPYDSELSEETMERDRLYDSGDWADYFRQFIGNGVYPNPATGLRVDSIHSSMVLTARVGAAFIHGRFYLQKADFDFSVTPAHLTFGRRDIVIVRHNIVARTTQLFYVPGIAAATPQPPPLVRTDDIFDLQLCTITVNPNVTMITPANILDTRPNNTVCGFVHGLIEQADTTELFNQYLSYLNEQIAFWNNMRITWINENESWIEALNKELDNLRNHILAMETTSWTLINNQFDDWSTKRGCNVVTSIDRGDPLAITETITVVATNFVLATRVSVRNPSGGITETVNFFPWTSTDGMVTTNTTRFTIIKTTTINPDGTILEEIR
jgi:hypothetical protein